MHSSKPSKDFESNSDNDRDYRCQYRADLPWLDLQRQNDNSIVLLSNLKELISPPNGVDAELRNRILASLLGLTIGDAVGAPVEFRPREYLAQHPVQDMTSGGTWGLALGQFTDDTSMALCLACSLVARKDFVPYDQLVRYKWWQRYGYMSSTGNCFDIGKATNSALARFGIRQMDFAEKHGIPTRDIDYLSDKKLLNQFPVNCSDEGSAGNGSLMRLAAIPLFFHKYPILALQYAGLSSQLTHADKRAVDACRYYAALIIAALNGEGKDQLLDKNFYSNHIHWFGDEKLDPHIYTIAKGSYQKSGESIKNIRGGGYVVNALEAALWAFYSDDNSFKKGVLLAVNLGDDTDTTAAIYGQLAGAYYGYKRLHQDWVKNIYAKDFIQCLSEWVAYEGSRWVPSDDEPSPAALVTAISTEHTDKQGHKSESSKSKKASASAKPSTKYSTKDAAEGPVDSERRRRSTIHTLDKFDSSKSLSVPSTTTRSKSKEKNDPKTRLYFHNQLKTAQDVYEHLLKKFGGSYEDQLAELRKRDVDAYWLLHMIDENNMERCGIQNAELKKKILKEILRLQTECPEKYASES